MIYLAKFFNLLIKIFNLKYYLKVEFYNTILGTKTQANGKNF